MSIFAFLLQRPTSLQRRRLTIKKLSHKENCFFNDDDAAATPSLSASAWRGRRATGWRWGGVPEKKKGWICFVMIARLPDGKNSTLLVALVVGWSWKRERNGRGKEFFCLIRKLNAFNYFLFDFILQDFTSRESKVKSIQVKAWTTYNLQLQYVMRDVLSPSIKPKYNVTL